MNITELRYLVAIMKWGSVSAAAKQLYAAQPNVSKALKNLEEEYGLRIRDASHIYGGYNDLNDFLRGKQNRQSERRREKPEPEKSQQKAEQPKKKNKGIRM